MKRHMKKRGKVRERKNEILDRTQEMEKKSDDKRHR